MKLANNFLFLFQASDGLREEAQRYMGYESLPTRYLTLPFDSTMGTNLNLLPYDFGVLFLLFFPLYFIWTFKKSIFWLFPFLIVFIAISIPSGFAAYYQIPLNDISIQLNSLGNANPGIFFSLVSFFVQIFLPVSILWESYFISHPEFSSQYSYFIILIFPLILQLYLVFIRRKWSEKEALMSLFILSVFFWVLLSSGIPWYGIFILPIGILILLMGSVKFNIVHPFIIFSVGLWFFFRLNGYYAKKDLQSYMVEAATIQYQMGVLDENKYQEILTKTPIKLIEFINQNLEHKIYRNGTNLHYFLKNSHDRVLEDNQLGTFKMLFDAFPEKSQLIKAMEVSGIKFLIIDLNMANIDKTPDKSLLKKYENLISILYENPKLQLIYTDRIVRSSETGELLQMMFDKGQEIVNPGSMAVFMII